MICQKDILFVFSEMKQHVNVKLHFPIYEEVSGFLRDGLSRCVQNRAAVTAGPSWPLTGSSRLFMALSQAPHDPSRAPHGSSRPLMAPHSP